MESTDALDIEGPTAASLDKALQSFGVQRQAFHGKTFIGNHVKKCLQVINLGFVNFETDFHLNQRYDHYHFPVNQLERMFQDNV